MALARMDPGDESVQHAALADSVEQPRRGEGRVVEHAGGRIMAGAGCFVQRRHRRRCAHDPTFDAPGPS